MSLHLVERLAGEVLARRTARQMDYAGSANLKTREPPVADDRGLAKITVPVCL